MDTCASCGHALDGGRFCTHCGTPRPEPDDHEPTRRIPRLADGSAAGAPVAGVDEDPDDWRTGTAERPAVGRGTSRWDGPRGAAPVSPPPTSPPPTSPPPTSPPPTGHPTARRSAVPPPPPVAESAARFPLFADEVRPPASDGTDELPVAGVAPVAPPPGSTSDRRAGRAWLPWVAGAVALVLVAVLGGWLLLGRDDSSSEPTPEPAAATGDRTPSSGSDPSPKSGQPKPGRPGELASTAVAHVPATAPPNQDLSGNMVRYEARNMLDGVPSTCWRMAGDGTGKEIVLDLPGPTRLTEVGLVNGYAKTATDQRGRTLDWYAGNRRVLTVEWSFDDGTTVTQGLRETRRMQTLRIEPVTTQSVRLRLVSVSKPGAGRASRDYTPISDVTLQGSAG